MPRASRRLFKNDFFIPLPGDFYNHIESGEITLNQCAVYIIVLRQCDFETGMWHGTAYKIHAALGGQVHLRTVQDAIKALCEKGFLCSFHKPNERGNYPILIHNFPVRTGKHKGCRLDAKATTDPLAPVYQRDTARRPREHRESNREGTASPTANRPRKDREATAQTPSVQDSHILDSPESPDGHEVLQRQEAQTFQPTQKTDANAALDGWLAGRICSILQEETGSVIVPTKSEKARLEALPTLNQAHGHLRVLLAFNHFVTDRVRSVSGLDYPISVFLNEADAHIRAIREVEEESARSDDALHTLAGQYGQECAENACAVLDEAGLWATASAVALLCELEKNADDAPWQAASDYAQLYARMESANRVHQMAWHSRT